MVQGREDTRHGRSPMFELHNKQKAQNREALVAAPQPVSIVVVAKWSPLGFVAVPLKRNPSLSGPTHGE